MYDICLRISPNICLTSLTRGLQVDKATLSYATLLGIFEETGIDNTDYNNLNTIFYAGKI